MLLRELTDKDREPIEAILRNTPAFREIDIKIALELIDDRATKREKSDYQFVVASDAETVLGYACYGPIPLTEESFDLYWLAVAPGRQRRKVGTSLMAKVIEQVIRQGGARIYAETSSANEYAPARSFYAASGFVEAARLPDFYRRNEAKVIYCLQLPHKNA